MIRNVRGNKLMEGISNLVLLPWVGPVKPNANVILYDGNIFVHITSVTTLVDTSGEFTTEIGFDYMDHNGKISMSSTNKPMRGYKMVKRGGSLPDIKEFILGLV